MKKPLLFSLLVLCPALYAGEVTSVRNHEPEAAISMPVNAAAEDNIGVPSA